MTTAIILAGGLGTRLRQVVADLPKPMAPIRGRPFLEYQLDYWIAQGVSRFVLSVGYRRESITSHFGRSYRGTPLDYVVEETPLGTGGGLLLAKQKVAGEPAFLLLNGDTYFEVQLSQLRAFHESKGADLTLTVFRVARGERYMGMEIADDGRVKALRPASATEPGLANGGVYWVETDVLSAGTWTAGDRLSFEDDMLPAAQSSGARLYAFECNGKFIDIGVPDDYGRASQLLSP